jgi:hypothetical protein
MRSWILPGKAGVARGMAVAGLCCVFAWTAGGSAGATATGAGAAAGGWKIQVLPLGDWTDSTAGGVSCAAARVCVGAGSYVDETDEQTALAYGWNGQAWTRQPTPSSEVDTGSALNGISCTGADACVAVGTATQTWNGTTWTPRPAPGLSGFTPGTLAGVSCAAADACTAVGYYYPSGNTVPLAERWNGEAWKIQASPVPAGSAAGDFAAVSCTAAGACVAVGNSVLSTGRELALAESWNGKTWRIVPTPNPSGAQAVFLNGVSCTSASACVAVGDFDRHTSGGPQLALAESWNGKVWTIEQVPGQAHASAYPSDYLQAVSCAAASSCTAVGSSVLSAYQMDTLAAVWNGKAWHLQATPNPPGSSSQLNGVFCRGAGRCVAVGSYGSNPDAFAEGEGGL